jgi:hypothetical protein
MDAIERTAGDRTRREFFLIGCGSLAAAMAGFVAATFRFAIPNVLYEPSPPVRDRPAGRFSAS